MDDFSRYYRSIDQALSQVNAERDAQAFKIQQDEEKEEEKNQKIDAVTVPFGFEAIKDGAIDAGKRTLKGYSKDLINRGVVSKELAEEIEKNGITKTIYRKAAKRLGEELGDPSTLGQRIRGSLQGSSSTSEPVSSEGLIEGLKDAPRIGLARRAIGFDGGERANPLFEGALDDTAPVKASSQGAKAFNVSDLANTKSSPRVIQKAAPPDQGPDQLKGKLPTEDMAGPAPPDAPAPQFGPDGEVVLPDPEVAKASVSENFDTYLNAMIDRLAAKPNLSQDDLFNAILSAQARGGYTPGTGLLKDNPAMKSVIPEGQPGAGSTTPSVADLQAKLGLRPGQIPAREGGEMQGLRAGAPPPEDELPGKGVVQGAIDRVASATTPQVPPAPDAPESIAQFDQVGKSILSKGLKGAGITDPTGDTLGGSSAGEGLLEGGASTDGAIDGAIAAAGAGADAAAAGEGFLNPVADIAAVGLGLATLLGGVFGTKVHHSQPKIQSMITQSSFGVTPE